MTKELLPCPFCGGEAERIELEDEANFGGTCIGCQKCGASSPVHFEFKENLESSWNERSDGLAAERKAISEETRRYASHYPQSSDGRNTFIMLAEWIESRGVGGVENPDAVIGEKRDGRPCDAPCDAVTGRDA